MDLLGNFREEGRDKGYPYREGHLKAFRRNAPAVLLGGLFAPLILILSLRMRVWDVDPKCLCRQHLLGEHRELHGLWNILTKHGGTGGYSQHPETKRWVGKTAALYARHEALVREMERRGYQHKTPLDARLAKGNARQDAFIDTIPAQKKLLAEKPCPCFSE